jgi:tRNA (guanine-N7-)-methyltransferase
VRQNYNYGSLSPYLGLADLTFPVDQAALFDRVAPLEAEIGFGTGEYLAGLAARSPERDFIGFEQNAKRIIKTLRKINDAGLTNIRLAQIDAAWAFEHVLGTGALEAVHCLFPCPWPKDKQEKHRLFKPAFLRQINSRLKPGGTLRIVTDHAPYADWIVAEAIDVGFAITRRAIPPTFGTKFEKKWTAAGQRMFDEMIFTKTSESGIQGQTPGTMKTYFLKKIDPGKAVFERVSGDVSVQFRDFMFDTGRKRGMVLAIVVEDGRTQYLWMSVALTSKGWCLCAAPGSSVIPTDGIQKAMEMAHAAFLESGK